MASCSSRASLNKKVVIAALILLLANSNTQYGTASSCFSSIFNFGDSLSDTGNLYVLYPRDYNGLLPHFAHPPYGETFFNGPNGRSCDGRLVIDFMAEYLGKPFLKPYVSVPSFLEGANFAVGGATVLNSTFFEERGIFDPLTKYSLQTQLGWFKQMFYSSCPLTPSDCKQQLGDSLVLMSIGGNDYNHALYYRWDEKENIPSFVPFVVNEIASAIKELIELGAVTIQVDGSLPLGCLSASLTVYGTSNKEDYDSNGCLIWINQLIQHHNDVLQEELYRIRKLYPHTTIIYGDYYNAAMQFYDTPRSFGFTGTNILRACCGEGGPYNYNASLECGNNTPYCENPSSYVDWDGFHLTEAAYKWLSIALYQGPFTFPQFHSSCVSKSIASV